MQNNKFLKAVFFVAAMAFGCCTSPATVRILSSDNLAMYTNIALFGDFLIRTYGDSAVAKFYEEAPGHGMYAYLTISKNGKTKTEIPDSISKDKIRKYFNTDVKTFKKLLSKYFSKQDTLYCWIYPDKFYRFKNREEAIEKLEKEDYKMLIGGLMPVSLINVKNEGDVFCYERLKEAIYLYKDLRFQSLRQPRKKEVVQDKHEMPNISIDDIDSIEIKTIGWDYMFGYEQDGFDRAGFDGIYEHLSSDPKNRERDTSNPYETRSIIVKDRLAKILLMSALYGLVPFRKEYVKELPYAVYKRSRGAVGDDGKVNLAPIPRDPACVIGKLTIHKSDGTKIEGYLSSDSIDIFNWRYRLGELSHFISEF